MVLNPAKKTAQTELRKARLALSQAEAAIGVALEEPMWTSMLKFKAQNEELTAIAAKTRSEVDRLDQELRAIPVRVPLHSIRLGATLMDEARALLSPSFRKSTYSPS
ncbi:hypothetical protein [Acidithrix ferrooxidans]|uniref:Uncharacterized protein n=1 Tax=Acidithrix ferrooxidans TaxID=1280514 RepID=A0A0D8HMB1_9ACTN|nr:hypothetical protein [Acidithrix ferrooxidans]KJF18882.1 hypothetical protein AXFE_01680 [Acidithrix ferrooxidans]